MNPPRGACRSAARAIVTLSAVAAAVRLAPARPLAGQEVSWSGSLQYASGSYIFAEPTRTWVLSTRLMAAAGPVRVALGAPLVLQNTGAVTTVGGGMLPTGGPDYMAVRGRSSGEVVPMRRGGGHEGMRAAVAQPTAFDSVTGPGEYVLNVGDPLLDVAVDVYAGTAGLRSVSVGALAKIPVTSLDSGIGTGEWDGAAAVSAAFGAGAATVFADLEYWIYGDLPGLELRDGPAYAVGLGIALSPRITTMLSLDGASPVIEGVTAPLSIGAALGISVSRGRSLTFGVGAGLSEASPDVSAFVGWRIGP